MDAMDMPFKISWGDKEKLRKMRVREDPGS